MRVNRAANRRRAADGLAISSRRSSDEEERGQRGDDAAEGEEGEERQEEPGQAEAQQVVAELFVRGELRRQPVGATEQRADDDQPDAAEQQAAQQSPRSRRRTRLRAAHAMRQQQEGERLRQGASELIDFLQARCRR